jgi:hypothetical protein
MLSTGITVPENRLGSRLVSRDATVSSNFLIEKMLVNISNEPGSH